jgi:hypothetical protein
MGGGFFRAVISQKYNDKDENWHVESVFGCDEAELLARLKIRIADPANRPLTVTCDDV